MQDIAIFITHDLIDELPDTEVVFHPSAIVKLSELESPRIMKKYSEDALGRTLLRGRDIVESKDMKIIVHAKKMVFYKLINNLFIRHDLVIKILKLALKSKNL